MGRASLLTTIALATIMMLSTFTSATSCAAEQAFYGVILPGQTLAYTVSVSTTQHLTFAFYPDDNGVTQQNVQFTVSKAGIPLCILTGDIIMACGFSATPGTFTMEVQGKVLYETSGHALDGAAVLPFHVSVFGTSVCIP